MYFVVIYSSLMFNLQAHNADCYVQVRFDPHFDVPCDWGSQQCIHWVELKHKANFTIAGPK